MANLDNQEIVVLRSLDAYRHSKKKVWKNGIMRPGKPIKHLAEWDGNKS